MSRLFDSGLDFRVAATLDEVTAAWHLVYLRYRQLGLIDANPWELHATPYARHERSLVVVGSKNAEVVSTLTIIHDTDWSLPLECAYPREIEDLRCRGRRLLEVGLLADRREQIARYIDALMSLFRFPWFNAKYTGCDIICGVHPHHAEFYEKVFGFVRCGPTRTYSRVKDHPVVLLRLDIAASLKLTELPRATKVYVENPLDESAFEGHASLMDPAVSQTRLGAYLNSLGHEP